MEHGGHGGMEHGGGGGKMDGCRMNMVWNWQTTNICILTSWWRVTTPLSLYVSLSLIALAGVFYEWLRLYIRHFDARLARSTSSSPLSTARHHHRRASLLLPTTNPPSASSSSSSSNARSSAETRPASMSKRRSLSTTSANLGIANRDGTDSKNWVKPLETTRIVQVWRSTLYATSIAISFVLMLVGMTFNAYVIAAIVAGAGLGHYWFNRELSSANPLLAGSLDDKGLACHM